MQQKEHVQKALLNNVELILRPKQMSIVKMHIVLKLLPSTGNINPMLKKQSLLKKHYLQLNVKWMIFLIKKGNYLVQRVPLIDLQHCKRKYLRILICGKTFKFSWIQKKDGWVVLLQNLIVMNSKTRYVHNKKQLVNSLEHSHQVLLLIELLLNSKEMLNRLPYIKKQLKFSQIQD